MERFNPITDLQPIDSVSAPTADISDEIESLRIRLIQTKKETDNVINIIKDKNNSLNSDLKKIKNLNRRLNITIPRIPSMPGEAGVQFGEEIEEEKRRKRLGIRLPPRFPLIRFPSRRPSKTPQITFKRKNLRKNVLKIKKGIDAAKVIKLSKTGVDIVRNPKATTDAIKTFRKGILQGGGRVIKKRQVTTGGKTGGNFVTKTANKIINPIKKFFAKDVPLKERMSAAYNKNRSIINKNRTDKKIKFKSDAEADSIAFKASTDKTVAKKVGEEALLDKILGKTYMKQKTLFETVPSIKNAVNPLIKQLRSGNVAKSKLYKTLGLDDKFTRNNFANYLEPANPKFQAKILRELGLIRGTSMKAPVSKDTFRFIMNAFKPSDFMLQQIRSGKMPTGIDPRIKIFNQLKDAGYKIKLKDIVPKKDYNLLEKGLKMEDMPFQKLDKQLQLNVPQDLSSLNIDTGITNTVIILTDPPVA